jgi:hypothetical protein
MNDEIQKLQTDLSNLRPAALEPDFLDRLELAVHGGLEELQPDHQATERLLTGLQPAKLPEQLSEALVGVTDKVAFPLGKKVLLFPGESSARKEPASRSSWMAAAACVALAGAIAAFFVKPPAGQEMTNSSARAPLTVVPSEASERGAFVPASFESDVSDTSDLGVVWARGSGPVRVLRMTYMDQVKLMNEQGEEAVFSVPRVQYLVVPEKVD